MPLRARSPALLKAGGTVSNKYNKEEIIKMNKLKTDHVDLNCFSFDEATYQAKLAAATITFNNDPTNYERLEKPSLLAYHFLQEAALEGKMLSSVHIPKQGPNGLIFYLIGDKYKEGLEALPAIIKAEYESELEAIKNKQKAILVNQLYQEKLKAEEDKKNKATQKTWEDAEERADTYFAELS